MELVEAEVMGAKVLGAEVMRAEVMGSKVLGAEVGNKGQSNEQFSLHNNKLSKHDCTIKTI